MADTTESAEQQMLAIIREAATESGDLRLSVVASGGKWTITLDAPGDGGGSASGRGATFVEAWHDLTPWWAAGGNDNAGGR